MAKVTEKREVTMVLDVAEASALERLLGEMSRVDTAKYLGCSSGDIRTELLSNIYWALRNGGKA